MYEDGRLYGKALKDARGRYEAVSDPVELVAVLEDRRWWNMYLDEAIGRLRRLGG